MKKFVLLLLANAVAIMLQAQSIGPATFNAAGHSGIIGSTTFESSFGEMAVVQTQSAGGITITHGVLQPNIGGPDGITDLLLQQNYFTIYPNPAAASVTIECKNEGVAIIGLQLMDVTGKLLWQANKPALINNQISFSLQDFALGQYVLRVQSAIASHIYSTSFILTKSN